MSGLRTFERASHHTTKNKFITKTVKSTSKKKKKGESIFVAERGGDRTVIGIEDLQDVMFIQERFQLQAFQMLLLSIAHFTIVKTNKVLGI